MKTNEMNMSQELPELDAAEIEAVAGGSLLSVLAGMAAGAAAGVEGGPAGVIVGAALGGLLLS